MAETPSILLVDDDSEALLSLARALKANSLKAQIEVATDSIKALASFKSNQIAVAVIDLSIDEKIGVESGFSLLQAILELDSSARVIVLTGHGSPEFGVRALKLGAASFIEKPAEIDHLLALIRDGLSQVELRRSFLTLKQSAPDALEQALIGNSDLMKRVREQSRLAAKNNLPVLLSGETGTGKGVVALAIHKLSLRASKQFVRYQPTFATADLVNSDLFGHERGSYTGALEERRGLLAEASNGTLFLDEIEELPIETQIMLLGVLQDRSFRKLGSNKEEHADFRLIAATNQPISECLSNGKIRADFYHRIAHIKIDLPALRLRRSDIPELATYFLTRFREKQQINISGFSDEALSRLQNYNWPGNVRELEACVEAAAWSASSQDRFVISASDFVLDRFEETASDTNLNVLVDRYKYKLVSEALDRNGGNQLRTAKELKVDRATIKRIIERGVEE